MAGATSYRVVLYTDTGRFVWGAKTTGTSLMYPGNLKIGQTCLWAVRGEAGTVVGAWNGGVFTPQP